MSSTILPKFQFHSRDQVWSPKTLERMYPIPSQVLTAEDRRRFRHADLCDFTDDELEREERRLCDRLAVEWKNAHPWLWERRDRVRAERARREEWSG
jgi:hypothetical protein